ncbi:MAG: peptide deformylase [Candidatus Omnitrophica bacterium]|nr:peptide deformylase [Candidatus Omnitrophota bacterium]
MNRQTRIVLFPDPVLRGACSDILHFDQHLIDLVNRLDSVMRRQKHGIGIAAPQIGIAKRLALVDVSARVQGAVRLVLVNPEIQDQGGTKVSREGCMSLPEYTADLKRSEWVALKWQDEFGKIHRDRFEGIEAVCIQHELDHLNGVLFLDRVVCLKTDMYPRVQRSKKV